MANRARGVRLGNWDGKRRGPTPACGGGKTQKGGWIEKIEMHRIQRGGKKIFSSNSTWNRPTIERERICPGRTGN